MSELKTVSVNFRKVILAVNGSENRNMLIRRFLFDLTAFFLIFAFAPLEKLAYYMLRTETVRTSELLLRGYTLFAKVAHFINLCVYYGCGDDVSLIVIVGAVVLPTVYAMLALREYAYFKNELC